MASGIKTFIYPVKDLDRAKGLAGRFQYGSVHAALPIEYACGDGTHVVHVALTHESSPR